MESLLGSRFASLKDVLVRIWGSDSTVDDVKAVMRTGLGSLEAKGVLRFEVHLATRYDIPIL